MKHMETYLIEKIREAEEKIKERTGHDSSVRFIGDSHFLQLEARLTPANKPVLGFQLTKPKSLFMNEFFGLFTETAIESFNRKLKEKE